MLKTDALTGRYFTTINARTNKREYISGARIFSILAHKYTADVTITILSSKQIASIDMQRFNLGAS